MQFSRRMLRSTLVALMLGLLILNSAFAQKGGGKGGGGNDDGGEPTTTPPFTYGIRLIEGIRVNHDTTSVNDSGDLVGQRLDSGGGGDEVVYEMYYGDQNYPVELFFLDLDVSPRYTYCISDRAEDGTVHLCGGCDTADGIRGWVMALTPGADGSLMRSGFSIAQPEIGDNITSLRSVNSSGEAVGYSRMSGSTEQVAIYHTSANSTVSFAFDTDRATFITNSGSWVGSLFEPDGSTAVYTWTPGGELQFLADVDNLRGVNNLGHFVGANSVTESTKRGTTENVYNYLYNGELIPLNENGNRYGTYNLNDFGDRLSIERIPGKG